MDSSGNLYQFDTEKSKIEKETELQQRLMEISQREYKTLSGLPREERIEKLGQIRAKDADEKKRAKRKMAKASKRRNRR